MILGKSNVVIAIRSGKKIDTHLGENNVNVYPLLSSTPLSSQESVSHNMSTFAYNAPFSKDAKEPRKDGSLATSDSAFAKVTPTSSPMASKLVPPFAN